MKSIKFTGIILYVIILMALIPDHVIAQSPMKISYQAVIRDTNNDLVINKSVGMRISVLSGSMDGKVEYEETQTPTTNSFGLISIEIGTGSSSDNLSQINWADGIYFVKTEIDLSGGTDYSISGTSQLLSVPYSFHSNTADSLIGSFTEMDPVFSATIAATITDSDTARWNNKLDSYTESDPVYGSSVAAGVTETDTTNWNNKLDSQVFIDSMQTLRNSILDITIQAMASVGYTNNKLLQASYHLDGNANDFSGNSNNGSIVGATPTIDRFGNQSSAFSFNGVDQYIDLSGNSGLELTSPYSISLWFYSKRTSGDSYILTADGMSYGIYIWEESNSNNDYIVFINGNSTNVNVLYSPDFDITINEWHHVVVTNDGSNMKIYFDGKEFEMYYNGNHQPFNETIFNTEFYGNPITIGYYYGNNTYFDGLIDDIKIFNKALNSNEVKLLFFEQKE